MAKALTQAGLETKHGEELHEQNEPGVGCESLLLELHLGDGMGLTADSGSARLHRADLLVACVLSAIYIYTRGQTKGSPFFHKVCRIYVTTDSLDPSASRRFVDLTGSEFRKPVSDGPQTPGFTGVLDALPAFFMQLRGYLWRRFHLIPGWKLSSAWGRANCGTGFQPVQHRLEICATNAGNE
jgi:hypothetical protein